MFFSNATHFIKPDDLNTNYLLSKNIDSTFNHFDIKGNSDIKSTTIMTIFSLDDTT